MIRILIVDDQNLVQQGIKSLLDRDLEFKVIGTVKDGRNAVKQIAQIHPDVVLLDIEMPGMNGITVTKYINRVSPQTKVIILSSHEDKKYVTQALMAGAKGYLLKDSLMTDLKQAILAVNNGYSQIDSKLLAKVFDPNKIKAKKTSPNREDSVEEQNVDSQIPQKSSSDVDEESKDTVSSVGETTSFTEPPTLEQPSTSTEPPTLEQPSTSTEPPTLEQPSTSTEPPTLEQPSTSTEPPTLEEEPKSVPQPKISATDTNTFSTNEPDSIILKKVNPETNSNGSNGHKQQPFPVSNPDRDRTTIATVKKESSQKQYKFPMPIGKPLRKTSGINYYLKRLLRISRSIRRSRLAKVEDKLRFLLEKQSKQSLRLNIGLAILAIIVVIIIGNI